MQLWSLSSHSDRSAASTPARPGQRSRYSRSGRPTPYFRLTWATSVRSRCSRYRRALTLESPMRSAHSVAEIASSVVRMAQHSQLRFPDSTLWQLRLFGRSRHRRAVRRVRRSVSGRPAGSVQHRAGSPVMLQSFAKRLVFERLDQIGNCAALHRLPYRLQFTGCGHHDDVDIREILPGPAQHLYPRHIG